MIEVLLIVAIAIFALFSAILSNNAKFFDKKYKGFKRVTKKGYKIMSLNFFIIIFTIGQYYYTDYQNKKKDKDLRNAYSESVERILKSQDLNTQQLKYNYDTTAFSLKNKYDTSTIDIIKALAVYGLKYDSSQKIIEKLSKISSVPDPVIQLKPGNEIAWDSSANHYELNFISSDAASGNFDIKNYALIEFNGDIFKYIPVSTVISKSTKLSKDEILQSGFTYKIPFKYLFIRLKGKYSNYDDSKSYPIDEIYQYDYAKKITSTLRNDFELWIRQKFDSYISKK